MGRPLPIELIAFVRERYASMSIVEITVAWNSLGGRQLTEQQIKSLTRNHGIKSGRDGRWKKEQTPWNLGLTGYMAANRTTFKTGDLPANLKPLWSERLNPKSGFIVMKVPEIDPYTGFPTRYKAKHIWVWEQVHGPVPKGSAVIFADSNRLNCEPDNLVLVTRAELLVLNSHRYSDQPAELFPSLLALARLEAKSGFRTCPARRGKRNKTSEVLKTSEVCPGQESK